MYSFTENQMIIIAWFRRNAPSLGELFEGAIRLLYEIRLPGYTRYISHSVREIRNRIPEVLAGIKGGDQLQYKNRMDSLAKKWSNSVLKREDDGMSLTQDSAKPSDEEIYISIPIEIYGEIDKLIHDHVGVSATRKVAAKKLFQAASDAKVENVGSLDPTIRNWLEITDWFMSYVHDSGDIDSTIDINYMKRQFKRFETMLNVLVGHFFSTTDELDEILRETNR